MKKKKNKIELSKKSELNKKIIQGMEELLQQATIADYRKALMDLFFEAAMVEDRPISFSIFSYRVQSIIHYLDGLDENIS